jgi:hypothetical protein
MMSICRNRQDIPKFPFQALPGHKKMNAILNETAITKAWIGQRVWGFLALLTVIVGLPMHASAMTRLENASIDAISANYDALSVRDCVPQSAPKNIVCNGQLFTLKVNDAALKARLKDFHVGDHVRIDFTDKNELQDLRGFWSVDVSEWPRTLVLVACALALLGFATVVTKGKPLKLIIGEDNRYSNSKFQVALWFWILLSTYLAIIVLRLADAGWEFFGRVSIPQNLLLLSGLSALTFGGAKAITTAKANAASAAAQANAMAAAAVVAAPAAAAVLAAPVIAEKTSKPVGKESFLQDLLQNDSGQFDFGDFQMLVVTLIAAGMYITLFLHFVGSIQFQYTVTLPDVDTTILASFGIGQGAYLTKKAAGNPGTS